MFDGLYERHPDFKFVVPHAGSLIPYFVGRIDHFGRIQRPGSTGAISVPASEHIRKFYVDTVCEWAPAMHLCCDFFGVDRVMHGTDHPFWPMPLGARLLDQLGLSPEDRAKVEHQNAERVFQIGVPAREVRAFGLEAALLDSPICRNSSRCSERFPMYRPPKC